MKKMSEIRVILWTFFFRKNIFLKKIFCISFSIINRPLIRIFFPENLKKIKNKKKISLRLTLKLKRLFLPLLSYFPNFFVIFILKRKVIYIILILFYVEIYCFLTFIFWDWILQLGREGKPTLLIFTLVFF